MRVEFSLTNEEIQVLLVPEGKMETSILDEISKAESAEMTLPMSRTERGVILKKVRANGAATPAPAQSGNPPTPRN